MISLHPHLQKQILAFAAVYHPCISLQNHGYGSVTQVKGMMPLWELEGEALKVFES